MSSRISERGKLLRAMKVLVTGSTGFIGKNLVRRLNEEGHEVRALVRATSKTTSFPSDVELVRGDVTDLESLRRAAAGCDAAFHLAAVVKSWVPDRNVFDRVNIGGLENMIRAGREMELGRIIYTSSFIALGPTDGYVADESQVHTGSGYRNDYERTKALADRVALQAAREGSPLVMLYPGVVYGPGEMTDGNLIVKMLSDHLRGRLPGIIGPGDRKWSYVFVGDVLTGHLAALERGRPGERYLLCGDNVTNQELFETWAEITGKAPPRVHIPYGVAKVLGLALVGVAHVTRIPPLLTHEVVEVFKHEWAYSSAKAEKELGYRPTPLRKGLERTLAWLKEKRLVA
jgi:farnesol dehydrogenase